MLNMYQIRLPMKRSLISSLAEKIDRSVLGLCFEFVVQTLDLNDHVFCRNSKIVWKLSETVQYDAYLSVWIMIVQILQ